MLNSYLISWCNKNRTHLLGKLLAMSLVLLGLGNMATAQANILVSVKPVAFIVSAIADGVTQTDVLLPDGASPHSYALKPSDLQKIKQSDLTLWIGPDMEAFLTKTMSSIPSDKQIVLENVPAIATIIKQDNILDKDDISHDHVATTTDNEDHALSRYNLHLWMSPEIASQIAQVVHDKLLIAYPNQKAKLDSNLKYFDNNLRNTEENIANKLKNVQNKGYFVFHDAYDYFENYFGLKSMGYFTVNPEIQPGAKKLASIKQALLDKQAVCVFSEPQFQPAIINSMVQGTGVKVGVLDPLGMGIKLGKNSYDQFLTQLANQFYSCLN